MEKAVPLGAAEQAVVEGALQGVFVDPQAGGGIALGVAVHQQRAFLENRQGGRQIDRRGGLADAALLVGYADYPCHLNGSTIKLSGWEEPSNT